MAKKKVPQAKFTTLAQKYRLPVEVLIVNDGCQQFYSSEEDFICSGDAEDETIVGVYTIIGFRKVILPKPEVELIDVTE